MSYNDRDQFKAATGPSYTATYLGTTNDERSTVTAGGTQLTYALSPLGLSQTSTASASVQAITRLPDGDPVSIRHTGSNTLYLTLDHLGSPTATTTPSGQEDATYAYDPYGKPRGNTSSLGIIGYAGGVEDPGGIIKFGARYYDPTTGRFTQMDPTGQENNPHAYAANNPINYIDPTGQSTCTDTGVVFGLVVAATLPLFPLSAIAAIGLGVSLTAAGALGVAISCD